MPRWARTTVLKRTQLAENRLGHAVPGTPHRARQPTPPLPPYPHPYPLGLPKPAASCPRLSSLLPPPRRLLPPRQLPVPPRPPFPLPPLVAAPVRGAPFAFSSLLPLLVVVCPAASFSLLSSLSLRPSAIRLQLRSPVLIPPPVRPAAFSPLRTSRSPSSSFLLHAGHFFLCAGAASPSSSFPG